MIGCLESSYNLTGLTLEHPCYRQASPTQAASLQQQTLGSLPMTLWTKTIHISLWYTCSTKSSKSPTNASQHPISVAFDSIDLGMKPNKDIAVPEASSRTGSEYIGILPTGMEDSEFSWEDVEVMIIESKRTVKEDGSAIWDEHLFCLFNNLRRFFALSSRVVIRSPSNINTQIIDFLLYCCYYSGNSQSLALVELPSILVTILPKCSPRARSSNPSSAFSSPSSTREMTGAIRCCAIKSVAALRSAFEFIVEPEIIN